MENKKLTYVDAGVNIEEGSRAVKLMEKFIKPTLNMNVLSRSGAFAGLFSLDMAQYDEPVLVSGTDGVGTKLKIAFMMNRHDTIGIDLVAMCVNDILCHGATPLFFLNYISTGKINAEKIADIVSGIALGCEQTKAALIGGETAEMPGFYTGDEYDIAGFSVGVVNRSKIVSGNKIEKGDVLIGISSSGIHSNGYSLVRKIFFEQLGYKVDTFVERLGMPIGEALLKPTRIYTLPVLEVLKHINVKGMCHITGGGFVENIPRILPEGLGACIDIGSWDVPEIFRMIQELGEIDTYEMYRTFNMGIGYIFIVAEDEAETLETILKDIGENAYRIGYITDMLKGVDLCQNIK